ncbi:MAG: hypothetical protein AAF434_16770 [Pseudomonadota bacterium]
MIGWISKRITRWLNAEKYTALMPPSDFEQLSYEIRPCDVLLVEGYSHVSEVIKHVTLSAWTHAAIYIGRLHDIDDPELRAKVIESLNVEPDEQLLVEAMLGEGTIIRPLSYYRNDHLRICRPNRLARQDAQLVLRYVIERLGRDYDVRQIFDLLRFFIPYAIMPRKWRSTLFESAAGESTKTVCSTLIGRAFASVHYPILPSLSQTEDGQLQLIRHNSKLLTPKDFDYSPYFDLIKYPVFHFDEMAVYRKLPWSEDSVIFSADSNYVSMHIGDHDAATTNKSRNGEDNEPLELTTETAEPDMGDFNGDNHPIAEQEESQLIPDDPEGAEPARKAVI